VISKLILLDKVLIQQMDVLKIVMSLRSLWLNIGSYYYQVVG